MQRVTPVGDGSSQSDAKEREKDNKDNKDAKDQKDKEKERERDREAKEGEKSEVLALYRKDAAKDIVRHDTPRHATTRYRAPFSLRFFASHRLRVFPLSRSQLKF